MTVQELIEVLQCFPLDALVYVPSLEDRCDVVLTASPLVHTNLPVGISIPDDVLLLPWTDEEYTRLSKQESKRL